MLTKVMLNVPMNRVEGDLEIRVEMEGDRVTDSWSSGTMFRGIENILTGRSALDGLVITPRVCGICGTSHLTAAVKALDAMADIQPPPEAIKVRNLTLMTEHLQSDVRQVFLMYAADFTNPAYRDLTLYEEAVRRYEPLRGETALEAVRETSKVLEIVAILGGQWPHSAFMVPGGVVSLPSQHDILQCENLLSRFKQWYERRVIGCSLQRILDIQSRDDLDRWLEEDDAHRSSDFGFFLRFGKEIGLESIGRSHDNFLSFGQLDLPADSNVRGWGEASGYLFPPGFSRGTSLSDFSQENVAEHVSHSWFEAYEGGLHPFVGNTKPYATGREGEQYSWAKAPRYDGHPAEVGPLAEMVVARIPLIMDWIGRNGSNALIRETARLMRPAYLIPAMEQWLAHMDPKADFYLSADTIVNGKGFGITEASRGALGHWVKIKDGEIEHYQIITPTAWNGSPRDSNDVRGPWEEALIGTQVKDPENPVELGHVVRSFDPCLVCTVHTLNRSQPKVRLLI